MTEKSFMPQIDHHARVSAWTRFSVAESTTVNLSVPGVLTIVTRVISATIMGLSRCYGLLTSCFASTLKGIQTWGSGSWNGLVKGLISRITNYCSEVECLHWKRVLRVLGTMSLDFLSPPCRFVIKFTNAINLLTLGSYRKWSEKDDWKLTMSWRVYSN